MPEKIQIRVKRDLCSGCLSCVTTCSLVNEGYVSLAAARIKVELSLFGGTHKIAVCRQCKRALCQEACPEDAIVRDGNGVLHIDRARCVNCRACVAACPFGAMFWNPINEQVVKCEQCRDELACVAACPTGALTIKVVQEKEK